MAYVLVQRRKDRRPVIENVLGVPIVVLPGVMNPKFFRTGLFLAEGLDGGLIPRGSSVFEIGSGSGVVSIFSARWASRVVAADISAAAVKCTRVNVAIHNLEDKIDVRQGDLFDPVGTERFDVILFNPPFLNGEPKSTFERAFFGEETISEFASKLKNHLLPGGMALVVLSTIANLGKISSFFRQNRLDLEPKSEKKYLNETLILYAVT